MHAKSVKLTSNLCSDMSYQEIDMVSPCDLNGASDEFFGSFFEHYDFPMEDLEGTIDWDALQLLQLPSSDELLSTSFSTKLGNENSGSFRSSSEKDVKPKINGGSSLGNSDTTAESSNMFHHKTTLQGKDSTFFPTTTTCVSVLESGSSWSSGDNSLQQHFGYQFFIPVKRARSKRLRPPTLNPKITMLFTSCLLEKRRAKRKNNFTAIDDSLESGLSGTRKCTHCEVTQTPQWREGPMGPKTLCNACGVRYRSGRLYPEYRPAASPTFVATVHSNSHKKVVEMRKKSTSSNSNGCLSV